MIIICILAEDQHAEKVRDKVKLVIPMLKEDNDSLRIPVSPTGEGPATHWFCFFKATQKIVDTLLTAREHSIIEVERPRRFLRKYNLKKIEVKNTNPLPRPNNLRHPHRQNKKS